MTKLYRVIDLIPKADTAWATVARINAVVTSIVFVFFYAGEAGKSEAGSFLLWLGVVNIAAALGGLGRAQFIYAEPAAAFRRGDTAAMVCFVMSSMMWICSCSAVLAWLGLWFGADSFEHAPSVPIVLLAMLTALLNFFAEILRVLRRFAYAAIVNPGTSYLALCAVLLVGDRLSIEPEFMLLYMLVGHACLGAVALVASWQTLGSSGAQVGHTWVRGSIGMPLPKYLWPYWLNTFPMVLLYQIDIVIVGFYFGPDMLAVYTMASRLAGGLSFVNSLAYVILPARISDLLIRGPKARIGEELRTFAKGLSILTAGMICFLMMGIFFGFPKLDGEDTFTGFSLLAAAHGFNCFLGARSVVLQLAGHAHLQASISWIFALICGALLLLAVASDKFILVFFAVAASIVGQAMTESWMLRRRLGVSSVPGIPDRTLF